MDPLFESDGLAARPLARGDGPAFKAFGDAVADYGEAFYGLDRQELSAIGAMRWLLNAPRPNLLAFGLFDGFGSIAGVLEVIVNHSMAGEWCVVLLMLHPDWCGLGIGAAIYRAFEAWAVSQGARSFLLAAVESNERALAFWSRLGYKPVASQAVVLGRRRHRAWVLARIAGSPARDGLAAPPPPKQD